MKLITIKSYFCSFLAMVGTSLSAICFAEPTSLILTTSNSSTQAINLTADLPVKVRESLNYREASAGVVEIRLGSFRNRQEAEIAKSFLGQISDFPVTVTQSIQEEPIEMVDVLPDIFTKSVAKSDQLEFQALTGRADYETLADLDTPGNEISYRDALLTKRNTTSDSDPLAGYIDLNLGITTLLAGNLYEAKQYFHPIANGEVSTAANHRLMAMWRLAWIAHQEQDHFTAYRIYAETEEFASNARTISRCVKERAGILMEIAKDMELGTLTEFREYVEENRAKALEFPDDLSTIDLMYLESFYYDGRRDEFLARVDSFLQNQPSSSRKQIATALVFKGVASFNAGDHEAGFTALESVLQMEFTAEDKWQKIDDFKLHALKWLVRLSRRTDDQQVMDYYQGLYDDRKRLLGVE